MSEIKRYYPMLRTSYDRGEPKARVEMEELDSGLFVLYDDISPLLAELEQLRNLKSYIFDELSDCMDSGCDSIQSFELLETMEKLRLIRKVPYDPKLHGTNLMDTIEPGEEIYWWGDDE